MHGFPKSGHIWCIIACEYAHCGNYTCTHTLYTCAFSWLLKLAFNYLNTYCLNFQATIHTSITFLSTYFIYIFVAITCSMVATLLWGKGDFVNEPFKYYCIELHMLTNTSEGELHWLYQNHKNKIIIL